MTVTINIWLLVGISVWLVSVYIASMFLAFMRDDDGDGWECSIIFGVLLGTFWPLIMVAVLLVRFILFCGYGRFR